MNFLVEHTKETDRELACQLADLTSDLEQARAYMPETGTSMAQYIDLFQTRQEEMLGRGTDSQDYHTPSPSLGNWLWSNCHRRRQTC